jgi:hypothetical protein
MDRMGRMKTEEEKGTVLNFFFLSALILFILSIRVNLSFTMGNR